MEKIIIILVMPNREPIMQEIKNSTDSLYGLVYYPYEEIQIDKNVYLIYSKEAKKNSFPLCRKYKEINIYSNFVIVARNQNKYMSLNVNQINKYINMFKLK